MFVKEFSLKEGNTPLVKSIRINFYTMTNTDIYFKVEDNNPTGSLTDRCIFAVLKNKLDKGIEASIATGCWKSAISSAAYSSRMGIKSFLIIPKETYSIDRIKNSLKFDTMVIEIDAEKKRIEEIVKEMCEEYPFINLSPGADKNYINGLKDLKNEILLEVEKVDYLFWGVDHTNLDIFKMSKNIFAPNEIEIVGVTNEESLKDDEDIVFVEEYEIEQAHHLLTKQEGLMKDKEAALSIAGYLNYENSFKLKDGDSIVCLLDGRHFNTEIEDEDVKLSIINVEDDIDRIKQIMGLK